MTLNVAHINLAKGLRGGEYQTLAIIEGLAGFDVQQTLICRKNSALEKKAVELNISTIGIGKPFILHAFRLKKFDLLHVHEGRSIYLALVVHLIYKIKYLVTRRIPNQPNSKSITKIAYNKASTIVSVSSAVNKVMQGFCENIQFEVIPDIARNLECNAESVARLKAKYEGKFIVGHVGALFDHHKNQSLILKTAQQLRSQSNIIFLLLGTGKDEMLLKKLAVSLSLNNVIFEGYKANVADYYALFDIFIYPSIEEGLGSAILEAFHFQKPVIAGNVDGIPDILGNNEYGLLIDPFDDYALAEAIMQLYQDDSLRNQYAVAGFRRKSSFSADKVCNQYMQSYQKIINNHD